MNQAGANPKPPVPVVSPRRILRWLDSLAWLAIAGALTAMLIPATPEQATSKRSGGDAESMTATASEKSLPSPYGPHDDVQFFPSGHEFMLQNEADFISQTPAPPGETNSSRDDSPRVTSGPALDGPQLGNPLPR